MSPLEQEQLLEQTRAAIRQNVAEIAELARTSRNGVQFFRDFLARIVAALQAQGGAIWIPGSDGREFQVVAEQSFATCAYHENERQRQDIIRVLGEVFKNRRPFIVGPSATDGSASAPTPSAEDEVMNTTPYPLFYVPVLIGEGQGQQVGAIVHVWLRAAGDPKTYPTLVTFLNSVCGHAASFLKARQGEAAMSRNLEYEHMLRLEGDLVGELDPLKVGRVAVNHFTDLFQANRCSIFRQIGGRWRLDFVSNQETIDQRSELVRQLCALAARLPVGKDPAALSLDNAETATEWSETLEPLGARQAAYAFYQPHHHDNTASGLVLLERHHADSPFTPVHLRQMQWAKQQLSRAMIAATTHREAPLRRVLRPVTHARGMWRQRRRVRLAAWVGIPVLLLALWLLVPWTLRVEGDCTIQPRRQATVAAETNGKIERVFVQEGQFVQKGDLLAKLEDEDIRTQIAVYIQDLNKSRGEVNRYQAAGDDANRKQAEISQLSAQAKLDRLRYLQSRAELRAPISGVVLTKNLANRVGETLEMGHPFCELAGREVYEVQIDLRQQDLGVLMEAFRRRHDLPADFILHAHTDTRLHTLIQGPEAISQMAKVRPGGTFFTVKADFPVDNALVNTLKPGYTGKAKIDLGHRPLAAVMLRKFFDYWRVEWSL